MTYAGKIFLKAAETLYCLCSCEGLGTDLSPGVDLLWLGHELSVASGHLNSLA